VPEPEGDPRREEHPRQGRAEDFYKTLQLDAFEWISLGTTTPLVYSLGNNAAPFRE